ncbi:MAG: DUF5421 family protein [Chlamydiia bacterium]|nr:DUF5421 family protein [Chlamydiia bacterium]
MGYTSPPSRGGEPPASGKPEEGPRPKKGKKDQEKFSLPQRKVPSSKDREEEEFFGMQKSKKKTPSPFEPGGLMGQSEGSEGAFSQKTPQLPPDQGNFGQFSYGTSTDGRSNSVTSTSQSANGGQTSEDTQSSETQRRQDQESGQQQGQGQAGGVDQSNKIIDAEVAAATSKGLNTDVAKITGIIKALVDKLYSGVIEGKKVTGMELKATNEIPEAFRGIQLTITETDRGLVINFSNFSNETQANAALRLVQGNQGQLVQLVNALQGKNIQLASIQIGNTNLQLQQTPGQEGAAYFQQGEGDQQRQQGEGESEEGEDEPTKE